MTKHILIVEDDWEIAQSLNLLLEKRGFSVTHLTNGLGVAWFLENNHPDLILLDVNLPGKDGITVCRETRANSDVPVFIMTTRHHEADRLRALETGANQYICKPFSIGSLIALIKTELQTIPPLPHSA